MRAASVFEQGVVNTPLSMQLRVRPELGQRQTTSTTTDGMQCDDHALERAPGYDETCDKRADCRERAGLFYDLLTQIASFTSALLSNALVCNLRCNKMGLQTGIYQLDPRGTKFFLLTTYLEGLAERGVNLQLFYRRQYPTRI